MRKMSGMAGTKRFMAPEVCSGLAYNEKVDVYSFGVVLWQICTLIKPFAGMNEATHFQQVVLQSCWHANPNLRPSMLTARQMLREVFVAGGGHPMW